MLSVEDSILKAVNNVRATHRGHLTAILGFEDPLYNTNELIRSNVWVDSTNDLFHVFSSHRTRVNKRDDSSPISVDSYFIL